MSFSHEAAVPSQQNISNCSWKIRKHPRKGEHQSPLMNLTIIITCFPLNSCIFFKLNPPCLAAEKLSKEKKKKLNSIYIASNSTTPNQTQHNHPPPNTPQKIKIKSILRLGLLVVYRLVA